MLSANQDAPSKRCCIALLAQLQAMEITYLSTIKQMMKFYFIIKR
jgi:hypothetical protein